MIAVFHTNQPLIQGTYLALLCGKLNASLEKSVGNLKRRVSDHYFGGGKKKSIAWWQAFAAMLMEDGYLEAASASYSKFVVLVRNTAKAAYWLQVGCCFYNQISRHEFITFMLRY